MGLKHLLQTYAGPTGRIFEASRGNSYVVTQQESQLPACILDWPNDWRRRFDLTAEAIGRLLPIDAFYADAAAEIAIREEFGLRYASSLTNSALPGGDC